MSLMTIQTLICKPIANEVRFDMVICRSQIGGYTTFHKKSNKRLVARTITRKTKREGQNTNNLQEPKKGRELVPLMVGSYFIHNSSNVACMQIVRSNRNGKSRTSITLHNLPPYSRGYNTLKCNINMMLEKLNAK
jgi:hypothetical protein